MTVEYKLVCRYDQLQAVKRLSFVPLRFFNHHHKPVKPGSRVTLRGTDMMPFENCTSRITVDNWNVEFKTPNDSLCVPFNNHLIYEADYFPHARLLVSTVCVPKLEHTNLFNIVSFLECPGCALKRLSNSQIVETAIVVASHPVFSNLTSDGLKAKDKLMIQSAEICKIRLLSNPFVVYQHPHNHATADADGDNK